MCGIVGYVGARAAAPVLLEGLQRLEYRGYDSAGIALLDDFSLNVRKTAGRVARLRQLVPDGLAATLGIAHTRWATHGPPTEVNAHPHVDAGGRIAVVHNGVIDNATALRNELTAAGVRLVSETDSEVLAHLIALTSARTLESAVRQALRQVDGTFGLLVVDARRPGEIVAARRGSPVVLGIGDHEMLVASDTAALVRHTQQVVYLDDDELAVVRPDEFRTGTLDDRRTTKHLTVIEAPAGDDVLGDHTDFMHKEMHEQVDAVDRCVRGRLDENAATARLDGLRLDPRQCRMIQRVTLIGCGSAYYAGQIGANLIEDLARIPARAEPASEFRYRNPVVDPDTLYIAVSQSGETHDTLAAVRELQRKGANVVGVVNNVSSSIARACGAGVFLHAGTEMSVAATKSFTTMVVAFALIAVKLGRVRDLPATRAAALITALRLLPGQIETVLKQEDDIAEIVRRYRDARHLFYVGRVRGWPVAREGAQKLKEISYLHAEAYQAGELKHGPLALITPQMPTVAIVPDDDLVARNLATIEEIKARGGPVIAVTSARLPAGLADATIEVPATEPALDPVLPSVGLQVLAWCWAHQLGREVDRPRNLAKSVTVE
ncbi:glutamine--fructose-6-phosphate transaminase (isomerizing) [Fodinicola acaciae]|uniref:glutamine--fructose-6-phosphate transaminase (isomerizing) n=1 Tax=Fodinicola acaciae TaxID=2681555 RepID=UPI0013D871BF|nr:glutamine--fructose-6-phosphate transaminase (isomerizing) [Fodinicola acaciae]